MLLIRCPWCGPRDHTEFVYGGDATAKRPADPLVTSDEEWFAYIYLRDNPKGPHTEYWQHVLGCRRWFKLTRNTATNELGDAT